MDTITLPIKRGDIVNIELLGERVIRQAVKSHNCKGWTKQGGHTIKAGELYIDTEGNMTAGGFGMDKSCLKCAGLIP